MYIFSISAVTQKHTSPTFTDMFRLVDLQIDGQTDVFPKNKTSNQKVDKSLSATENEELGRLSFWSIFNSVVYWTFSRKRRNHTNKPHWSLGRKGKSQKCTCSKVRESWSWFDERHGLRKATFLFPGEDMSVFLSPIKSETLAPQRCSLKIKSTYTQKLTPNW